MKRKLLIATHNPAKLHEIAQLLADLPLTLLSLADVHITDEPLEDGKTFEENSQKKAVFYARLSALPSLADDGGLEIAALQGEPGVRSKRWLGEDTTEEELIKHMIHLSRTLPDANRDATFSTAMTLALPDGQMWTESGMISGIIPKKYLTNHIPGFPYRSFFYLPTIKKFHHNDELTSEDEKRYNHRYIAINRLKPVIVKELGT